MTVIINGSEKELPDGATLSECIAAMGLDPGAVVAELNGRIMGRDEFASTRLNTSDRLELLHFVGGG